MTIAFFHFTKSLDFFLPHNLRGQTITVTFRGRQTIKHLIESLGIPHTEAGQVFINGESRNQDDVPHDGDRIEIEAELSIPPIEPCFLLDGHLGRLTAHLRMLGFDCLYDARYNDEKLAKVVMREVRILLSRDRRLLMRKVVTYGYCPRSLDPKEQLLEVLDRYELAGRVKPFLRCIRCNHPLGSIGKEAILDRLEPLTKKYFEEFRICPACRQIYWRGSHYERMQAFIARIVKK